MSDVERFLPVPEYQRLKELLGRNIHFRCWAMTESLRHYFDSMKPGDIVLLEVNGTYSFKYWGKVIYKVETEQLGMNLWEFVPGRPWKLIYVFREVREVNIPNRVLYNELRFERNFILRGTIRVSNDRVNEIIRRYGSIESFVHELERRGT